MESEAIKPYLTLSLIKVMTSQDKTANAKNNAQNHLSAKA